MLPDIRQPHKRREYRAELARERIERLKYQGRAARLERELKNIPWWVRRVCARLGRAGGKRTEGAI